MTSLDFDLARLGELLELSPAGVIVRDFDSDTITYWSRGAEEMYGWSREEAIGQDDLAALVEPVHADRVEETADVRQAGGS